MNLEQKNMALDSFMEEYKEKSLVEKQKILIEELKELIVISEKICADRGIRYDLLFNREIIDINKENYTQDDYVEAVYAYIQMFKEVLSSYILSNYNN